MADDLTPTTRVERLLAEILGEDYAVVPVTRIEKFLSNILGADYDLIPATRIEKFLAKIAEDGGGGGDPLKYLAMFADGSLGTEIDTIKLDVTEIRLGAVFSNLPGIKVISIPYGPFPSQGYLFNNNPDLEVLVCYIPTALGTLSQSNNCPKLRVADMLTDKIPNSNFNNDTLFNTLILRSSTPTALNNINAFRGTPFASDGTGGTLYVPNALIAAYQTATNWSTILGYANNQILPIEGSIYEAQYADGTPIT